MRLLLITIMTLGLGVNATSGQTSISELSSLAAARGAPQGNPASLPKADALPPLRLLLPAVAFPTTAPIPAATAQGVVVISPNNGSRRRLSPQDAYEDAIVDCMRMWDARTHMTKRDWLRTCKRFEARVEGLKLDAK
jgi:hypothetical protein